ncbi:MAG: Dabb family protein [Candidatus Riflebacteria bacterium]|nr:Dabb family protein [Candidatus Riflebacteria bacterium]
MLRHIVFWKFKKDANGDSSEKNTKEAKRRLATLPALIPQIRKYELGIAQNTGPAAMDLSLISEFDDRQALDSYINHPDHKKVSEFISTIREARAVVDYEI